MQAHSSRARLVVGLVTVLLGASLAGAQETGDPPPPATPATPAPAFTPEQQAKLDEAATLAAEVLKLFQAQRYSKALPIAKRVLELRESVLEGDHAALAFAMFDIGAQYTGLHDFDPAIEWTTRGMAMVERLEGPDSPTLANALGNLAAVYTWSGRAGEALAIARRSLELAELNHGPDSPQVDIPLDNYFSVLMEARRRRQALPYIERLIARRERGSPEHGMSVEFLRRLQIQIRGELGDIGPDLKAEQDTLAELEARHGAVHPAIASSLEYIADLQARLGQHAAARASMARAVAIHTELYGAGSRPVAKSRMLQCSVLHQCRRYPAALEAGRLALQGLDHHIDGPHPDRARARYHLAATLHYLGRNVEARPHVEEATRMFETLGDEWLSDMSGCLSLQGIILLRVGALPQAERMMRRALEVALKADPPDESQVISSYDALTGVLIAQGRHDEADALFRTALERGSRALGADHDRVVQMRTNRVSNNTFRGMWDTAEAELRDILGILEERYGTEHLALCHPLSQLAEVLARSGRVEDGLVVRRRELALLGEILGKGHPRTVESVRRMNEWLVEGGQWEDAGRNALANLGHIESTLRLQFPGLPEAERLSWAGRLRPHLDQWIAIAAALKRDAYPEVLRFKGLVARIGAAEHRLAREAGEEAQDRVEELREVERDVARLANAYPRRRSERARWRSRYAAASAERERLAAELAADFAPLRAGLDRVDLRPADIRAALRPGEVLVDFLRTNGGYVAWILRNDDGPTDRIPLTGVAETLDDAVAEFARRSSDPATSIDDAQWIRSGRAVSAILLAPVMKALQEDTTAIVFCPDAALSLVPFAALPVPGAEGEFLIDRWEISCVSMAQDLAPFADAAPRGSGALVVGAVDYAKPGAARDADERSEAAPGLVALRSIRGAGGRTFTPLPHTKTEVESVAKQLGKETTVLTGRDATESRVRDLARGHRFLHIATHGFVRDNLMAGLRKGRDEEEWLGAEAERRLAAGFDPLLLAGLALAGAGTGDGGEGDDGILTAAEVSHMDLRGVELVTLSACDTARGHVAAGDGVVGLVRSFQMAGAHHVLASLWPVDDEATRLLMEKTYAALLADGGTTPAAALRKAALAVRGATGAKGRAFAGPAYWAAFGVYRRE